MNIQLRNSLYETLGKVITASLIVLCVYNLWKQKKLNHFLVKEYICQCLNDIMMPRGTRAARACDVLMVKILNKCTLSILVYNLFYRQTAQYFHTPVSMLSSWNTSLNFQKNTAIWLSQKIGQTPRENHRWQLWYLHLLITLHT
mgnify:CR=1 FL=1